MVFVQALLVPALLAVGACSSAGTRDTEAAIEEPHFAEARRQLAESASDYAEPIRERPNPRIIGAIGKIPRHRFVPASQRAFAYQDEALPIGENQTISQPSLVALMTHLLRPKDSDVMLEVGTGSGYQAAILSTLVRHVYTIEIVGPLARQSARRLAEMGYANVTVRHGDGYAGWPEHAPFDGIIVTAGAPHVPQPLLNQLKPGGRMVIPVGSEHSIQQLKLIRKDLQGKMMEEVIVPVRFVPLTRELKHN